MVLLNVLLRVLPELLVVLAGDEATTHARDLLHALIVRAPDVPGEPPAAPPKRPRNVVETCPRDYRPNKRKEQ